MSKYWFFLEGIGGSGKTTQIELLKEVLSKKYPELSITYIEEFSNSTIGNFIKGNLGEGDFRIKNIDSVYRHLIVIADRLNTIRKLLAVNNSDIVIFDRFILSDGQVGMQERVKFSAR